MVVLDVLFQFMNHKEINPVSSRVYLLLRKYTSYLLISLNSPPIRLFTFSVVTNASLNCIVAVLLSYLLILNYRLINLLTNSKIISNI